MGYWLLVYLTMEKQGLSWRELHKPKSPTKIIIDYVCQVFQKDYNAKSKQGRVIRQIDVNWILSPDYRWKSILLEH